MAPSMRLCCIKNIKNIKYIKLISPPSMRGPGSGIVEGSGLLVLLSLSTRVFSKQGGHSRHNLERVAEASGVDVNHHRGYNSSKHLRTPSQATNSPKFKVLCKAPLAPVQASAPEAHGVIIARSAVLGCKARRATSVKCMVGKVVVPSQHLASRAGGPELARWFRPLPISTARNLPNGQAAFAAYAKA